MKVTAEDIETRELKRSLLWRGPIARAVLGLARLLGWLSFLVILAAALAENHPSLERWVAQTVQEKVGGPLTRSVEVADIDIRWLRRSVAVRGIAMGPTGEELRVDEVCLRIGWGWSRGIHVDRVDVDGGTFVVSELMTVDMDGPRDDAATTIDLLAESPEVVVRNVAISIAPPTGERIDVGSVDLHVTRITDELASIYGRLVPALGKRPEDCGVVWLNGTIDADRVARVRGIAKELPLSPDPLDTGTGSSGLLPPSLVEFDPRARVDLRAYGSFELGRSLLPEVSATLRATEGTLVLPWLEDAEERPLRGVEVVLDVAFAPPDPEHPFDPDAWRATGSLSATFEELRASAGLRVGEDAPAEAAFDAWLSLPQAPLGSELSELMGEAKVIRSLRTMLDPNGRADFAVGVRLPRSFDRTRPLGHELERYLLVRPKGDADLAYYGLPGVRKPRPAIGFPLRVEGATGEVTWSVRKGGRYPGQLAFYDMTAYQPGGPVRVQGTRHFTPDWMFADPALVDLVPSPFHLIVETSNIPIDDAFYDAFEGLRPVEGLADVLPTWNPRGGEVDFRLEIWETESADGTNLAIDAGFDGVGVRWRELGVPVEDAEGRLLVRTSGADARSEVLLDMEASASVARGPITARGRVIGDGPKRGLMWFDVAATEVNPVHRVLREELRRKNPATLTALDSAGLAGFVDVAVDIVQPIPQVEARARRVSDANASPYLGGLEARTVARPSDDRSGVQIQPSKIGLVTREVHGRVIATTRIPPRAGPPGEQREEGAPIATGAATSVDARVQGALRQDGPGVPVVGLVEARTGAAPELLAFGAGVDIANKALIGGLTDLSRSSTTGRSADPFDTDTLDVEGRIDFLARVVLPDAPGNPIEDMEVEVDARLDRLAIRENQLMRDVSAHVRVDAATGEWIGEKVDALLGETPVELTDFSFQPTEFGSRLRARLRAEGLPIDREHLSYFLDERAVRTILEDLDASGTFDMNGAEIEVVKRPDGTTAFGLDGDLSVRDAFVHLGVPIEIRRIDSMRLGLAHEGRGLRARATISGLLGAIAGRRLEDASLQLCYVEPRLVLEAVDGSFEGGRMTAVGSDLAPGASLFTIDLAPPFPFRLGAQVTDVDVGEFLRGVFDSDFANRGRMDLTMRLEGDFEHLTEMKGGGRILIEESALWAIPVFQALSVSLGIDTTVLFEKIDCSYSIADGVLVLDRMRVDSDLLALVGTGSISFEGDVTSDFEVRYDLVDRLGPLTQLLYLIQNNLLRVSVRGTMERPTVVLRGLISQFLKPAEERDRLPLPGFSRRPSRF
ncbi:MAG: hypothetical protein AAGB93_05570 [Planctomycetota bacterium]